MISKRPRSQAGLTLLEALVSITVLSLVAIPLSAIVLNHQRGREANQQQLYVQQSMNVVLTTFTNDVRAGIGLMTSRKQTDAFTIRQPLPDGGYTYVTYRFSKERLERGTSSDATSLPTEWRDVIDPQLFKVAGGAFAYYSIQNQDPRNDREVRRIELRDLTLRSSAGETYRPPAVSAVMRELPNARILRLFGPVSQNQGTGQNQGATWFRFTARNTSNAPITLGAFRAEWNDKPAPNNETYIDTVTVALEAVNGSGETWRGVYPTGEAPQVLPRSVTLAPGQAIAVDAKFRMSKRTFVYRTMRFQFYEAASDLTNPFVIPVLD